MERLSIVVTTRNHFLLTRLCLESILWTLPEDAYEILIVDDGSSDETLGLAKYFRFIPNRAGGLYESWNLGVQAANTEYVAVLNNDVFFCMQDWWPRMEAVFQSTAADWLFPLTVETQSLVATMHATVSEAIRDTRVRFQPTPGAIEACSFILRKSLFETLGPFDSRFKIWYGEKDYEVRMLQQKILYGRVDNVVVRHFGSSTLGLAVRGASELRTRAEQEARYAELATADYTVFRSKFSEEALEAVGLRMPPFGALALKQD
jgi:glycosyltransferase involved in cell wall biosynthesis